jgi:TPR repeat protein
LIQRSNSSYLIEEAKKYFHGDGVKKDTLKAITLLQQLIDQNCPDSMYILASIYKKGENVEQDKERAVTLFKQAIDLNHSVSMHTLACMYQTGDGVVKSTIKAITLYRQAIEHNNPDSMHNLAWLYQTGNVVEQNTERAISLFKRAIERNHPDSMHKLACIYQDRYGVDSELAIELYQKACDLDYPYSIHNLACMYQEGDGVKEDKKRAIELYQKASVLNYPKSIYNLALMYQDGDGIEKDEIKVVELLELSAKLDDPKSIYLLAFKYKYGIGVNINKTRAIDLFKRSLNQGNSGANLYIPHQLVEDFFEKNKFQNKLKNEFEILEETILQIKKSHIISEPTSLSHFTSWATIESILPITITKDPRNILRLYHVDYMNDPAEGRALINFKSNDVEISEILLRIFEGGLSASEDDVVSLIPPSMYSLSFTESSDRLDLWRAYGNDGDGYSIVTVFDDLDENRAYEKCSLDEFVKHKRSVVNTSRINNCMQLKIKKKEKAINPVLFRVSYTSDEKQTTLDKLATPLKKIVDLIDDIDGLLKKEVEQIIYALLLEVMYLYKDEQYSTEREIRVIRAMPLDAVKVDERIPERLYCETSSFLFIKKNSKIIIGPKVKNKQVALWNLRFRLEQNNFGNTTNISMSQVKYR